MNLPACLSKIIGSRKSDWNLPSDFGLYVEQLPGVTQSELMSIRTPDYANDADFVTDMINFSMTNIVQNLSQWLIQNFRQGSIIDRAVVGKIPLGKQLTYNALAPVSRGVKLLRTNSDFYGKLVIGRIEFIANTTGTVTITVTDNIGQIQTYTDNAVAGVPLLIQTNFQTQGSLVTVLVDNTAIATAELDVADCCGYSYSMSNNKGWRVEGFDGVGQSKQTYGLRFEFTYECDQTQIACLFRNSFTFQQACLYRFGVDYCDQLATTPRKNPATIHRTAESIAEMRLRFETEMERSLEMIRIEAQQMLSKPNTVCIACNGTRYVETSQQFKGHF